MLPVRLACVKHAASVRSEPGSNSQVHQTSGIRRRRSPTRELTSQYPSIPSPPGHPAKPPGTDPATTTPTRQASTHQAAPPAHPTPHPRHRNRSSQNTPQNPPPNHPTQNRQTATLTLNALPKPDAVFNERLPCGRPEACRLGPTGTRPCRVGSPAFQRGRELSGVNH